MPLFNSELNSKNVLCKKYVITSILVPVGQNWVLLSEDNAEAPPEVCSILEDSEGAIVAQSALSGVNFEAHELIKVAGNNVTPKNICVIRDASTGKQLQSNNLDVYGLLQTESTSVDGYNFNDTDNRVKLSLVVLTSSLDDFEPCSISSVENKNINYSYIIRNNLEIIQEDCFVSSDSFITSNVLPVATKVGNILYSTDGITLSVECPLTGDDGWLVNEEGILMVVG